MKKTLLIVISLFLLQVQTAYAQVISNKVYAITASDLCFESLEINQNIALHSIAEYEVPNNNTIKHGDEITVKLKEYVNPKRGKRNGYYKIEYLENNQPVYYGTMRPSTPKDMKDIAKKAGVSIAGHILKIPGFSQAIAVSKGLLSPKEEEGRLKSVGKNLYESTPLTYVEKGTDFQVTKDGIVVLKLKELKD